MIDPDDDEIDRILNMSDDEILSDLRARGEDPEEFAAQTREIFERAVRQARRSQCSLCGLRRMRGCTACCFYYCKDCQNDRS